jgi:hypothetical protein
LPKKVAPPSRPDKRKKKGAFRPTPATLTQPATAVASAAPAAAAAPAALAAARPAWSSGQRTSTRSTGTIRAEDYHYIYSDLRRIGILAGTVFAILAVLSFVLR